MLYAQTHDKDRPLRWSTVESLWSHFNRVGGAALNYQLIWERSMFGGVAPEEQIRAHLRKWHRDAQGSYPLPVLTTTDPQQMEAAIIMLIVEAKDNNERVQSLWNGSNGTTF